MNKNKLYHPYTNAQGKRVNGPPALLHYICSVKGGVQQYNDEIGEEYIKAFVQKNSDAINERIVCKKQKKLFKIVS